MQDIITAEIIREYLETVSEEISKTMENTSVSVVFSEAHDYSTGVFYYDGKRVNLRQTAAVREARRRARTERAAADAAAG